MRRKPISAVRPTPDGACCASGMTMAASLADRPTGPALQRMLADIRARQIDVIVVYKVDRLTRSLADFAKLVELFDAHAVSFVSVTQQFNTTTSMGRLTLNVLLSFAQFEREVTSERIRDRSVPRSARASGSVVSSRSAIKQRTARSAWSRKRPRSSGTASAATSNTAA
jgi:Resolvase, N terminal domain